MVGWHHQLNGHGFGWTPGVGDGQGGLECCSPRGRKESDTTEHTHATHTCVVRRRDNIGVLITFGGIDLCGSSDSIQEDGILKIHVSFSIKL